MVRGHKYGARKTTIDGITFDSQAEASYYRRLLLLQRAGEVTENQLQPVYELQPGYTRNGKKVRAINYVADFLVTYKDGRQELIDVKGHKTKEYLLKKKIFEYKYPDMQIVEVGA
jgi:hypothetical protein